MCCSFSKSWLVYTEANRFRLKLNVEILKTITVSYNVCHCREHCIHWPAIPVITLVCNVPDKTAFTLLVLSKLPVFYLLLRKFQNLKIGSSVTVTHKLCGVKCVTFCNVASEALIEQSFIIFYFVFLH